MVTICALASSVVIDIRMLGCISSSSIENIHHPNKYQLIMLFVLFYVQVLFIGMTCISLVLYPSYSYVTEHIPISSVLAVCKYY